MTQDPPIRRRLAVEADFQPLGPRPLKNIAQPVGIFALGRAFLAT